jgi:hypothetical protein
MGRKGATLSDKTARSDLCLTAVPVLSEVRPAELAVLLAEHHQDVPVAGWLTSALHGKAHL